MLYTVKRLSEMDERYVDEAISLFIEGFYYILSKTFMKDKEILHAILKDSFDISMVYICMHEDHVVGFLGLGNNQRRPINPKIETCQSLIGKFRGGMMYRGLNQQSKPVVQGSHEGHIDQITTDSKLRGKGVASHMMKYIFENIPYSSYTLEVLSKNESAVKLYQKLGFKQIKASLNPLVLIYGMGRALTMKLDIN